MLLAQTRQFQPLSLWGELVGGQRAVVPRALPLHRTSAQVFNELQLCRRRGLEMMSACWIDLQITLV